MVAMGLRWGALQGPRGGEREERDKKDRKPHVIRMCVSGHERERRTGTGTRTRER